MALFITFEGGEGCGKSVQSRALYRRLTQLAILTVLTHEPGGTPLSRKIGRWLKWTQDTDISPVAELLLFNASRAQLVEELISPSLGEGKVVICDRYADSTTVYQGYGRGLDLKTVAAVNEAGTTGLKPHLTFLLDMPVEEAMKRKDGEKRDRFEEEDREFHRRVRQGYLKLASAEPQRWVVINATQSRQKIAEIIWRHVRTLLR